MLYAGGGGGVMYNSPDFTCFHLLFNVATRKCKITYMASLYLCWQRRVNRVGG